MKTLALLRVVLDPLLFVALVFFAILAIHRGDKIEEIALVCWAILLKLNMIERKP